MIHENEVLMLILGLGVFVFIHANKRFVKLIRSHNILLISFYFLLIGWISTVLEGLIAEKLFNFMEHISYLISSILFAVWSIQVFGKKKKEAL